MKAAWLVLVLAGCGGAPFTAAVVIPEDAGDEGAPALTPDAGGADVLAREGGGEDGNPVGETSASPDASCVPFAISEDAGACFGNDLDQGSAHAGMVWGDAGHCGEVATPTECQCVETYDCACFDAHHVIDGDDLCAGVGTWGGCQMENGLPVIICR